MTQERIRFAGDPIVGESGSGAEPQIPLDKRVRPTEVEMLNKKEEDTPKDFRAANKGRRAQVVEDAEDEDEIEDEEAPGYDRERVGARIGQPLEEAQSVVEVERRLDEDDVIPMVFPTAVNLNHEGLMHHWQPGVHLVPVSIAGEVPKQRHWWLKHNRVRHAGKRIANPAKAFA